MDNQSDLTTLSIKLGLRLQERGYLLALAESCTGGLVAAAITDIAGSSAWFDRGFVTYSNAAKQSMLGVSAKTLEDYGAVSEQTAVEMAEGVIAHSQSDITGSITGVAGPGGGSVEKPVGTVCFAWATKSGASASETVLFAGNRQAIRHQAVIKLLTNLIETLEIIK